MKAFTIASIVALLASTGSQTSNPDSDGFIRDWLVLAPLAMSGDSGAAEIDREFVSGEASLRPKAGDRIAAGGTAPVWVAHQTSDYFIDFLQAFGKDHGEYVGAYAATYIEAPEEMTVTLALSTNDQGKAWLNGKEVFKFADTRVLEKDSDLIPVTLSKGQNVLLLKVLNEVNNWQACARFLRGTAPVTELKVSLAPQ